MKIILILIHGVFGQDKKPSDNTFTTKFTVGTMATPQSPTAKNIAPTKTDISSSISQGYLHNGISSEVLIAMISFGVIVGILILCAILRKFTRKDSIVSISEMKCLELDPKSSENMGIYVIESLLESKENSKRDSNNFVKDGSSIGTTNRKPSRSRNLRSATTENDSVRWQHLGSKGSINSKNELLQQVDRIVSSPTIRAKQDKKLHLPVNQSGAAEELPITYITIDQYSTEAPKVMYDEYQQPIDAVIFDEYFTVGNVLHDGYGNAYAVADDGFAYPIGYIDYYSEIPNDEETTVTTKP